MARFEISPSEALLLGQCLGEFREGKPEDRLLTYIRRRLEAYVPDRGFFTQLPAPHLSARDFTEFAFSLVELNETMTLGACRKTKRLIIEIHRSREDIAKAVDNDDLEEVYPIHFFMSCPAPRFLLDLLLMHYGDCLLLLPAESVLRHVLITPTFLEDWDDFVSRFFESSNARAALASIVSQCDDDLPQVAKHITALAEANDCSEEFLTGELFGAAEGVLQSEEERLVAFNEEDAAEISEAIWDGRWHWYNYFDYTETDFYRPPNASLIGQLLERPLIQKTRYTRCLLESLRDIKFQYRCAPGELVSNEEALQSEMAYNIRECRQRLWTAFGALVSTFSRSQDEFDRRQTDALLPRAFAEVCKHDPKSIGSEIHRLAVLLESPHFAPQDAVRIMSAGVEGLVARVWPLETNRENGIGRTLRDKLHATQDLERRFAAIANSLWQQYRRPATHEVDFACSFQEARYFLTGIWALADLAERIEEKRSR